MRETSSVLRVIWDDYLMFMMNFKAEAFDVSKLGDSAF